MRELPEPEGQLAWQTYTRDQVLAIQKQAYEDGLRDAKEACEKKNPHPDQWSDQREFAVRSAVLDCASTIQSMLTASQKEQQ